MENSKKKPGGIVNPERNHSLDLKRLYKSQISKVGEIEKRISDGNVKEDVNNKKRKSGKEVSFRRYESGAKKSRKGDDNVVKLDLGSSQKSSFGSEGSLGISLALGDNGSGFNFPKRPRGSARKKKREIVKILELLELPNSIDHVGVSEAKNITSVKENGSDSRLLSTVVPVSNSCVISKKYGKKDITCKSNSKQKTLGVSNHKADSSRLTPKKKCNPGLGEVKLDNSRLGVKANDTVVLNGDTLSIKPQRNLKKRKNLVACIDDEECPRNASEPCSGSPVSVRPLIEFLDDEDEDEENLEQNAARMLSSRFDPSCTGFSSKRNLSSPETANGFSSPVSLARDSFNRDEKGKRASRKRRQFYELCPSDMDAYWILKRRIKVFRPLDENWYYGLVNDYCSENKLHHIKYDDQEDEWVDLHKKKFKLLLLPCEVPGKTKSSKKSTGIRNVHVPYTDSRSEDDSGGDNSLDSKPIASWLSSSSRRIKALSSSSKNKDASKVYLPMVSLLPSEETDELDGKMFHSNRCECGSSYKSACGDKLTVRGTIGESLPERTSCSQHGKYMVYTRKKFRTKIITGSMPIDIKAYENTLAPAEVGCWNTEEGKSLYEFRLLICLPAFQFSDLSHGKWDFQLLYDTWMLQYGVLISTSPAVILQILFIDSHRGLSFLLFEGCMKLALALIFQILAVFNQVGEPCFGDIKVPITSLRFGFYHPSVWMRQHVFAFAFHSFVRLQSSKWHFLESKILRNCLCIKQLPVLDCTHNNVKEFARGTHGQPNFHIDLEHYSIEVFSNNLVQGDVPLGKDTSSMPPISAAQSYFLTMHLRSLMKHSVAVNSKCLQKCAEFESTPFASEDVSAKHDAGISEKEVSALSVSEQHFGMDVVLVGNDIGESRSSQRLQNKTLVDGEKDNSDKEVTEISPKLMGQSHESETREEWSEEIAVSSSSTSVPPSVTYPIANPQTGPSSDGMINGNGCISTTHDTKVNGNVINGIVLNHSPNSTCPIHDRAVSSSRGHQSPLLPDANTNFLGGFSSGPKRPRSQVQHVLPFAGYDFSSKQETKNPTSLPCKRIGKAGPKRTSDRSKDNPKSLDSLICVANVLVTHGDQGWRECGARVILEVADHNEWRVAVKISGVTSYSYKVTHIMQPASTNRVTNAMMWKGGKDWVLEFPDRNQWSRFKEMHEECYNRNIRAASVKCIPIPGVRLVEGCDYYRTEAPFFRNPTNYIRQFQSDVQRALDPSRVLYDMDSDDERWLVAYSKNCNDKDDGVEISEDLFEKIMDVFEKFSYVQLRDKFTELEIEELVNGIGSLEASKSIYEYWRLKRDRKAMPLIRHLQPPLWESYQRQLKEWERTVGGNHPLSGDQEKPQMSAFCQRPRILDVKNKGSKQRSQKRFPVSGHHRASFMDEDGFPFGRKSNGYAFSTRTLSPRGARFIEISESNPYRKVYKNRQRKLGTYPSFSNNERTMRNRNRAEQWNMVLPEPSTQGHYYKQGVVDQLNGFYLEAFRLRDAAKHAHDLATVKREKAQRLFSRADLAIYKAAGALLTVEAVKGCIKDSSCGT